LSRKITRASLGGSLIDETMGGAHQWRALAAACAFAIRWHLDFSDTNPFLYYKAI